VQPAPGSLQGRLAALGARPVGPARCDVFAFRDLTPVERPTSRSGCSVASVHACDLRRGELLWDTGPGGVLTFHVVLACSQGWFVVRRSAGARDPGLWQHAATSELTPADLRSTSDGRLDWRTLARRGLAEQTGLVIEDAVVQPWLLQRFVGPSPRLDVYVVVDGREFSFERLVRSRRRAPAASLADGAAVIGSFSDWSGREVREGLLAPAASTRSLLSLLVR